VVIAGLACQLIGAKSLNRLGQRHGRRIVRAVPAGESLPGSVVAEIMSRTDGVPVYIEGLTRSIAGGREHLERNADPGDSTRRPA
jgi:hypothetical protein